MAPAAPPVVEGLPTSADLRTYEQQARLATIADATPDDGGIAVDGGKVEPGGRALLASPPRQG